MKHAPASRICLTATTLLALTAACAGPRLKYAPLLTTEGRTATLLIRDVSVFNGRDTHLLAHQDVFVTQDVIAWVGPTGSWKKDADRVISGTGMYLSPGYTDAHVHVMATGAVPWQKAAPDMEHNLEAYLSCGVTTVFDLGGPAALLEKLEQKVNAGKIAGPSILHTHSPVTAPGSHPLPSMDVLMKGPAKKLLMGMILTADSPDDAAGIIEVLQKKGVDYVKLICDQIPSGSPYLQEPVMKALIEAAHAQDYPVFVHIGSPENAMAAIRSGADFLAHMPWRGLLTQAQADSIRASGAAMIFTLGGFEGVGHMCTGSFEPTRLEMTHTHPDIYTPASGTAGMEIREQPVLGDFAQEAQAHMGEWAENLRRIRTAGVPFLIGTDSPIPGAYEGGAYHKEMQRLQDMGFSPGEIMLAATAAAPERLGLLNRGTVEAGSRADMVLLTGNPLADVRNAAEIRYVIREGRVFSPCTGRED